MVTELHQLCSLLEDQPRILIVSGAGDDFAAGADIAELRLRARDDALAGNNRSVFDRIAALPLPTIAPVEGNALGGGAELAYACDIRIAGTGARFANPEPGLTRPDDLGEAVNVDGVHYPISNASWTGRIVLTR